MVDPSKSQTQGMSLNVESLVSLRRDNPEAYQKLISEASPEEFAAFNYSWKHWARPEQLPPAWPWFVWLILGGRGYGKTRTAAEWIIERVRTGIARRIALVGDTAADARDVMVEGDSGIMACSHPYERPNYEPSKRRLTWDNGAVATCYAAESPESLRGPQHDTAWCDEPAKWKNLRKTDIEGGTAWDNLEFGLRIGSSPQIVCSTSPRPIKWLKDLKGRSSTAVTGGSTYDNRANLSEQFFKNVVARHEGTRLGRQEIHAELLEDVEGALWNLGRIDALRRKDHPPLVRIVVALDPSVSNTEESDECGIVVGGIDENHEGHVLADLSKRCSPDEWARIAVDAYHRFNADRIIGEANNGGDLIETVLRTVDPNIPYTKVHASRGKYTRAEPVAALYEQGKVHHVGSFPAMEDEQCTWVPGDKSPNRMDALVWCMSELMLGERFEVLFEA